MRGSHFGTMEERKRSSPGSTGGCIAVVRAEERTQNGEATTEHYRSRIPQPVGAPIDARVGANVCRMNGGGAPQVKAAAAAHLRAMVDPALGVLE